VKKLFFNVAGTVALLLGIAGVFLPLLPTTPFLLLASACYLRGSERMHRRLREHRVLGPYLHSFESGQGIPARAKIWALALMWISLAISAWIIPVPWIRGLLLVPGIGVTVYLLRMPTLRRAVPSNQGSRQSPLK
jgi:uncharacterized membrane protein YbaN (DUF454 family)